MLKSQQEQTHALSRVKHFPAFNNLGAVAEASTRAAGQVVCQHATCWDLELDCCQ